MNEIMTLPVYTALPVVGMAIGWFARNLHDAWSAYRQRQRRWANTVGVDGDAPDLDRSTWVEQLAPPPLRVRVPGTTLPPKRTPGAALALDPPRRVPYVPKHGHDQLAMPTAAYTILDPPTQTLPTTTGQQFYALARANWDTAERDVLAAYRCDSCRANRHRDCPGCECPCSDAYVAEVSRG